MTIRGLALLAAMSLIAPTRSTAQHADTLGQRGSIELRFAKRVPQAGLVEMQHPGRPGYLYVEQQAFISPSGIERVRVSTDRSSVSLHLIMSKAVDDEAAHLSARRVGDHVALLVEGQLVDAWEIRGRIGGTLTHSHSIGVDATSLPPGSLQRIAARWPSSR